MEREVGCFPDQCYLEEPKNRGKAVSFYLNISRVSFAKENKWNKQTVKSEDIFCWEIILFSDREAFIVSSIVS